VTDCPLGGQHEPRCAKCGAPQDRVLSIDHGLVEAQGTTILMPHVEGLDWSRDGFTCGPDIECDAWEYRTASNCTSYASVELVADEGRVTVLLCGRHYGLHRRGVTVRLCLVVVPRA
jgi:hypothetical protein